MNVPQLNEVKEQERIQPMKNHLFQFINNRKLVCCESAKIAFIR